MLTPLQERIAAVLRTLPEAGPFVLAGGAALILQGRTARVTDDLDFFARLPSEVDALLPALERALAVAGLSVERRQVGAGFARLEVSDGGDRCQVDLGYDYRLMPVQESHLGPILSAEELAADKVLAVHGRAAARDYLDLHSLVQQFGYLRPLEWAREKDPGFSPAVFADRLGQMDRLPRQDYRIDDDGLETVRRDFGEWRGRLLRVGF